MQARIEFVYPEPDRRVLTGGPVVVAGCGLSSYAAYILIFRYSCLIGNFSLTNPGFEVHIPKAMSNDKTQMSSKCPSPNAQNRCFRQVWVCSVFDIGY
jgi:hypothetical protein